jgi:hypothetical protein
MARDYTSIGIVLADTKSRKAAIESFSRGLETLKELEKRLVTMILLLIELKDIFQNYKRIRTTVAN